MPADHPAQGPEGGRKNALAGEVSPYLLQHVYNPVDWFPWGPEAFEKAAAEDKPVFLSIGYSTCHWCHVMEKESFSDPEVARLMNETFVSVKVDREERPDIDHYFMAVCQGMTGGGGWPLTIIMTPEGKPFFSATYLPERSRGGLIGMVELVERIRELWKGRRDDLFRSADEITSAMKKMSESTPAQGGGRDLSQPVFEYLEEVYDQDYGGFSAAPKFPVPHNLLFLLRYWRRNGHQPALDMVEGTIQHLRRGGIYDQIGYGFHRYSTDAMWLIPHFEKMLYDQALLSMVYVEAYQATGKEGYRITAEEIFEYVLRDMTSPDGAFFSAEDADSEGEEGKYYWWTEAQIKDLLGGVKAGVALAAFSVSDRGNFPPGSGRNILHVTEPLSVAAEKLGLGEEESWDILESARRDLLSARGKRIPPLKDDKVLTDWNGLMIAALAKAGAAFDHDGYVETAVKATEFIMKNMQEKNGRLLHRWRLGEAALEGNLDDYSFFTWGLIELYQATFDVRYLKEALNLQDLTLTLFWDEGSAGFFFTPEGDGELPLRMKIYEDTAMPSGNSVAAYNLFRLGRLTGNSSYEEKGDSLGRAFQGRIGGFPTASTMWVAASDFGLGPTSEVAVVGNPGGEDTQTMLRSLRSHYLPEAVIVLVPPGNEGEGIRAAAPFTRDLKAIDGRATAYVCRNFSCGLPTGDLSVMLEQLGVKA